MFRQCITDLTLYSQNRSFFWNGCFSCTSSSFQLVHRFVNNCNDHAGCGFECAVPVRSDPQTSEWHSYFENDVPVSEFAFFLQYIYNTDVGIKRSKIRHDQQMKPVQAGRRNTQGERNMTNKPIYIKIYDKIKPLLKAAPTRQEVFFPQSRSLKPYIRSAALLSERQ